MADGRALRGGWNHTEIHMERLLLLVCLDAEGVQNKGGIVEMWLV